MVGSWNDKGWIPVFIAMFLGFKGVLVFSFIAK